MFFLQYRILPAADHPEQDRLGEGLMCCWIDRPTLDEADEFARADLAERKWTVVEREHGFEADESDFDEDEDLLAFYRQALTDHEVFVYNQSPRYPVYWVIAAVRRDEEPSEGEAHYFLCGEAIVQEDEDVYDPDFWTGERETIARNAAQETIGEAGWTVVEVRQSRPCGRSDVPEDMVDYYDEAEDEGVCLVFVVDDPVAGDGEVEESENDKSD
jgi:hypothetical protein